MADLKLVGAVAIKVRPDATKFREEAQVQIRKELAGVHPEVTVDVDADTTKAKNAIKRAKAEAEKESITIHVNYDYDSLRGVERQLEQAIKRAGADKIEVSLDGDELERQLEEIRGLIDASDVEVKFTPDEQGYRQVLAKIDEIRRKNAEIEITFGIDETSLNEQEAKIRGLLDAMAPQVSENLHIQIDADRTSLEHAIAEINKNLDRIHGIEGPLELEIGLDEPSLLAARKELQARMDHTPVNVRVDVDDQDSLKRTRAKLDAMLSDLRSIDVSVQPDEESILETRRRIDNLIQDENGQNIDLPVNPTGLALVAARLGYASRPRTVPFYVTVNKKSLAVAEGLMKSLAGINVLQKTGNFLENMISNFDKIAIAGAGWSSVIASLADTLIYLVGATLSVGGGLAQMVGLLALGPAAFGVLASTMIIGVSVFKDFGAAVHGIDAALKRLPPSGQKAALMVRGVFASMRESISTNFWDTASDSMLKFATHALPAFTSGLTKAAGGLGKVFAGVLDSFTNLAITGGLDDMFKGLLGFFTEGAKGATSLWNALNTLGLNGSALLPKFGKWLADISAQFDHWITAAHASGDIQRWIQNGVRSLQSLWDASGSTINIFKALTRAFNDAGHTGLGGFANSLKRVSDIMLGEPFQHQLSDIFEGARKGASGLNSGIRDLGRSFMDSSRFMRDMLQGLGDLAGDAVSAIALIFSNQHFKSGTLNALRGMRDAMTIMTPGFRNLGSIIGHLGDIAGSVFTGIAPLMNTISRSLNGQFDVIGANLVKIVPQLMSLMNGFLTTFNGPLTVIISGLNAVLGIVNSLPDPLKGVTVALVAMLLLRGQFASFFAALDNGWKRMNASAGNGVAQDGVLRKLRNAWSLTATSVVRDAEQMPPRGITSRFTAMGSAIGGVARGIAGSIKMAFLSLTGGWIGLAVIAIGVAFATLGQKAAAAQAKIDELQSTLSKTTGAATDDTISTISKALATAGGSGGGRAPIDTMKLLGITAKDTATQIAAGGAAYANLQKTLTGAYAAWEAGVKSVQSANPQEQIAAGSAALQAYGKSVGIAGDLSKLTGQDILNLGLAAQGQSQDLSTVKNAWKDINSTMEASTQRTLDFDAAMQKLHDSTADMPSRIQAFRDAMDTLNGKVRTTEEIQKSYNSAVSDMGDFLKDSTSGFDTVAKKQDFWNGVINKSTGAIDTVSRAGQNLDTQLHALSGQEIGIVINMQEKGAKPEEITKSLNDARKAWIAQATQAGISADAAGKAWDHMMEGLPKEVATLITTKGLDQAGSDLKTYKNLLATLDGTRAVAHLVGDDTDLAEKIIVSGSKLSDFNKIVATATAKLDPTQAEVVRQQLVVELANLAESDPTVKAKLDPAIFEDARSKIMAEIITLDHEEPTPQVKALIAEAERQLAIINAALADTGNKKPTPKVDADTSSASTSLGYIDGILTMVAGRRPRPVVTVNDQASTSIFHIIGLLNDLDGKTATSYITTRITTVNDVINHVATGAGGRGGITVGGRNGWLSGSKFLPEIVKFAQGGFHYERPGNAKIYPAASTARVFAEASTGGEAFIPMSISKRSRSEQILSEVASRFGMQVTKAQKFANGSPVAPPGTSVDAQVHIGTINTVDPQGAISVLQQKRRDAMALAGRPLN